MRYSTLGDGEEGIDDGHPTTSGMCKSHVGFGPDRFVADHFSNPKKYALSEMARQPARDMSLIDRIRLALGIKLQP